MLGDSRITWLSFALLSLTAQVVDAQQADSTHSVSTPAVTGVVHDSIASAPLADAVVQLVDANNKATFARTAKSDVLGRFAFTDVPNGRYMLGFFHPMLDSLGVEPLVREVKVDGSPVRADLAIPSLGRMRSVICGPQPATNSGALVVGFVRDARDGKPASGVTVTGQWVELSFRRNGVVRQTPRVVATTADNGWFAMCNVPTGGSMTFVASRGGDSTDVIEVQVPLSGFLRNELFIGSARAVSSDGITGAPLDEAAPRPIHLGDGRVKGVVYASLDGRPIANALVTIVDGPSARTDANGQWAISDAPVGTRMLEVHALGYYPDRRLVHVVTNATPVRVPLSTLQAVLDTVKVRSSRLSNRDRSGFQDRRHAGVGRYLTAADIQRRPATFASDIFKSIHGIRIGYASDTLATDMAISVSPDALNTTDRRLLMRGIEGDWCAPAIYLDGVFMSQMSADEIDAWIQPKHIAGIEIYSEATVPNDFMQRRSGCGTIVIWRK